MFKNILSYLLIVFAFALTVTSCSDDIGLNGETQDGQKRQYKGTLTFNLSLPDVSLRSRTVNTASGGSLQIKNLWIGVFNTTTGECFGSKRYDDFDQVMQSGVIFNKMLTVDFVAYDENLPLAYIVAVANYDNVITWDGKQVSAILPDYNDHKTINWDDIINLEIDTRSAYIGNKGENENSTAPFLVGFYQDAVSLTRNPKIDQFTYDRLGPSALYPATAAEGMDIQLGDETDGNIYVAAGAICLRRLVSHNNVKINTSNGFEITDAKYRRYNMPKTVYMLQRRTDTNQYTDFSLWQKNSPNSADHHLLEGLYDFSESSFPYQNDNDWLPIEISSSEFVEFSFDHFENKHWGFGNLQNQEDREARNRDGRTFSALCAGTQDEYNNFASYFVLKLHLINQSTGESADVEYTLHEGFCNTDDGRLAETMEEKCHDFGSFRNVNYTYNINIAGVNDIKASVDSKPDQPAQHPNSQAGSIWKMNFATGNAKIPVPIAGGEFNYDNQYMTFSKSPDLGFRIYGTDAKGNIVDICYNMPDGMLNGFAGLWPDGNPVYVSKSQKSTLASLIPQNLLDGMKIGAGSSYYDILQLLNGIENGSINPLSKFTSRFYQYDGKSVGLTSNILRGIYIFDRNDDRNGNDRDGCSSYYIAYGAQQYPFAFEKLKFDINNILWDNIYYKMASDKANVLAATTQIFYGGQGSAIDLRWKHDSRFQGYTISVYNANYTHPPITVSGTDLSKYLKNVKGETVFVYPLSTATFPKSTGTGALNYSFDITPIVDTSLYEGAETTHVVHGTNGDDATCIRVCPTAWDITSTNDWKTIDVAGLTGGVEAHYRGLGLVIATTSSVAAQYSAKGSFICFGGAGNTTNRYFSFRATVPGKIAVSCRSHSGSADASRQLVIVRMSNNGGMTNTDGEKYDEVYKSGAMAGSKTTYTSGTLTLDNGQPTEFRIYTAGSTDVYKIEFIPN